MGGRISISKCFRRSRALLGLGFLLLSGEAPAVDVPAAFLEIVIYRCATDQELAFGTIGAEAWGPNWHYIEYRVRCRKT